MPLYLYRCGAGHEHERLEPMIGGDSRASEMIADPDSMWLPIGALFEVPPPDCPECGLRMERVPAAAAVPRDGTYSYGSRR
jgi:hypothetical protein